MDTDEEQLLLQNLGTDTGTSRVDLQLLPTPPAEYPSSLASKTTRPLVFRRPMPGFQLSDTT